MTDLHPHRRKPGARSYCGIEPRDGDVITLDVTVIGVYKDGSVVGCEVLDEDGRTLAVFSLPVGYGNIVWRPDGPLVADEVSA